MAHVRQSRPDPGFGLGHFQLEGPQILFKLVPLRSEDTGVSEIRRGISGTCCHFRAKREQLKGVDGLLSENKGRNLALTVLRVPDSLGSSLAASNSKTAQKATENRVYVNDWIVDPDSLESGVPDVNWCGGLVGVGGFKCGDRGSTGIPRS